MTSPVTPVKIQIAFNVMAYCQSVQSTTFDRSPVGMAKSPGRPLTKHEQGMLVAAQNLTRDFLNGEIELDGPVPGVPIPGADGMAFQVGVQVPELGICEDESEEDSFKDDEDSSPEDFPF